MNQLNTTLAPSSINTYLLDLPHANEPIEWWYVNGHLTTETHQEYSFFACFFRNNEGYTRDHYSVMWALVDVANQKYYSQNLLDNNTAEIVLLQHQKGRLPFADKAFEKAFIETFKKGSTPLPDVTMQAEPIIGKDELLLKLDHQKFYKEKNTYCLSLSIEEEEIDLNIEFKPKKPVCQFGEKGQVLNASGKYMHYYFYSNCAVKGKLQIKDSLSTVKGSCWFDHEFGTGGSKNDSWNWFSFMLPDNEELMVYEYKQDNNTYSIKAILIDKNGKQFYSNKASVKANKYWRSIRSMKEYPMSWEVKIPDFDIHLKADATFPDQEVHCLIPTPSFWEGRIYFTGKKLHQTIKGIGMCEMSGFNQNNNLQGYLKTLTKATAASLEKILPNQLDKQHIELLIASGKDDTIHNQIDAEDLEKTIVAPIKELFDRSSKCWRPAIPIIACQLIGKDPQPFEDWVFFAELLHVGSLMIDDVQDKSATRRSGPAIHTLYGEALTITTGTAAYFLGHDVIYKSNLTNLQKVECYNVYHNCLKTAHVGQALDIQGFYHQMKYNGSSQQYLYEVEEKILAAYRLKTGMPCRYLAELGVICGNGSKEQREIIGDFMEQVGIAFQIVDDVLNIKGFGNDSKERGEDIKQGKLTIPILNYLKQSKDFGKDLEIFQTYEALQVDQVEQLCQLLECAGSLDKAMKQAYEMVDKAWHEFDRQIKDSHAKITLRALIDYLMRRKI